jgi:aminoglycoside 2'-N-acetyltransferase I
LPQLLSYSKNEMPRDIALQIVSYVRIQWPFLLGQKTPLWESAPYPADGKHFVLVDGDALIAHALAHHKMVEHGGRQWKVGALSSVFTYPTHRGTGYGEQVASAATQWLRESGTDFALLFCGERVKSLYLRQGWEHLPPLRVTYGDVGELKKYEEEYLGGFVLIMLVSESAAAAKSQLENQPIYVGQNTW